jgi:hypothetical protein
MVAAVPRKFTLLDAMVLIAAVAVALFPIRFLLGEIGHFTVEWSATQIWSLGFAVDAMLCPLALALSPALRVLRWRRPRPGFARIFRQPGMAACTAAVVDELFFVTATLISLFLHYFLRLYNNLHLFYS